MSKPTTVAVMRTDITTDSAFGASRSMCPRTRVAIIVARTGSVPSAANIFEAKVSALLVVESARAPEQRGRCRFE